MSRNSQRPSLTFRSARRANYEAAEARKQEVKERIDAARAAMGISGNYCPPSRDDRYVGRSGTFEGGIYHNSNSSNSNNNNCNIKVIHSTRRDDRPVDWESRPRVSRYSSGNTITCLELNNRVKGITFAEPEDRNSESKSRPDVKRIPTGEYAESDTRAVYTNNDYDFGNHAAIYKGNAEARHYYPAEQEKYQSQVIRRPIRIEPDNRHLNKETEPIKVTKDEEPTCVKTNCDTGLTKVNSTSTSDKQETGKTGVDSSNNNKLIRPSAGNDPCKIDNLIIEHHEKESGVSPDSNAAVEAEPDLTSIEKEGSKSTQQSPTKTTASTENKTGESQVVTQDSAFSDPRQAQVFQTLTGVQKLRHDTTFADVVVKIDDAEFRCHHFILAINCPHILAQLDDDSANVNEEEADSQVAPETDTKTDENEEQKEEENDDGGDGKAAHEEIADSEIPVVNIETKAKEEEKTEEINANKEKDQKCIQLTGFKPDIFSKILDFMYCQFEGVLTEDNCVDLLLAANSLELHHLRRTCATFVTESLSSNNVFQILALWDAGHANLFEPKVLKKAHQVIRENFAQLSSLDDFLRVSRHVMIPLIADSMLHIRSEMEVLQALLRWVRARPEERCSDMTLMLQHVRFPLMSSRELEKLKDVPILQQNSLAMALIEESRAYGNLDYNERMAWPRHNSISRCLFSTRDLIMWTADRDKGLHFYSIIDGQHHKVTSFGELTAPPQHPSLPGGLSGVNFSFDSTSSVCCYGDKIFFTGGEFNTDMVWSVDTSSGEVKVHAKMPRGRKFHSMVAVKGCVYCLGGQDKRGYTVLEDVDAYIINKDMWVKVGHLAVPAYNMSAAVSGGAIYLVGGLDYAGQPLRIIQCFISLRSGLYSAFKVEIDNMPPSLLSARAVACGLDKSIYIVCGHGEVYQFEPDRQCISHMTTLRNLSDNPRVRFGLAYMGGCLVIIGGHQLGHVLHEPIRSVCLDIASKTEVRDYSPLLPGDIANTCLAAKLSSNILRLFKE